jgi:hypothetical protein
VSCIGKTQLKFWKYIEEQNPTIDFKFDTGHLSASSKLYRLPYQNKECKAGTAHIILCGETKDFIINYVEECKDVTDVINELYEDSPITTYSEDSIDTNEDTGKIEEFAKIIKMPYINNYNDWLKIVWSIRSMGEILKPVALEMSKRSLKYTSVGFVDAWFNYKGNKCNKITARTFYHYCKISNEVKYLKLCKKYAIQSITEDEDDQINDYFNLDLAGIESKTESSKYIGCDIENKLIFDSNIINDKHIILYGDMGKGK